MKFEYAIINRSTISLQVKATYKFTQKFDYDNKIKLGSCKIKLGINNN